MTGCGKLMILMVVFSVGCMGSGAVTTRDTGIDPAAFEKVLMGTWGCDAIPSAYTETTYRPDHTFSARIFFKLGGQPLEVEVTGTWEVADGSLIETSLASNYPELLEGMGPSRDKILSFSINEIVIMTEAGDRHIHRRKVGGRPTDV